MSKESSDIINGLEKEWSSLLRPLIERLRGGDPEAIAEFVMKYQQRVRSVAMDVLMDADLAVKATYATFRSAIVQLQNGVETRQVEPWLLWIARNEALALTQVASPKQRTTAGQGQTAPKPICVETEAPEEVNVVTAEPDDADRFASEAKNRAANQEDIDTRILSFLRSEPPLRMKDQGAQLSAADTVLPTATEPYSAEMPQAVRRTDEAEPREWVAERQEYRRDAAPAAERTETRKSSASTDGDGSPAEDDAHLRIKNRERKRLQGLETENVSTYEPAEAGQESEYRSGEPRATIGDVLLTAGLTAVALLLVWIVLGLLSNNGVLNLPDLGYSWFNENVFYLF